MCRLGVKALRFTYATTGMMLTERYLCESISQLEIGSSQDKESLKMASEDFFDEF
jgi:hypothetical protein